MKTIIHDLDYLDKLNNTFILDSNNINYCIGCFNCWTSSPMKCIHKDKCNETSKKILESDTLIIISECCYGTYSSKVKKILERNISIVLPYFTIRNKEIHHKTRINKKNNLIVLFYGNVDELEKELATSLVNRNKYNFNYNTPTILFFKNEEEIRRYLNEFIY